MSKQHLEALLSNRVHGTGVLCYFYLLHDAGVAFESCFPWLLLESPGNVGQESTGSALLCFSLRDGDLSRSHIAAIGLLSTYIAKLVSL